MSNSSETTINPAVEPKSEPALLTPEEAMQQLRALRERMPRLEIAPATPAIRRRLAHVDPMFVQASVNTVGASDEIQRTLGRSDADMRQDIEASTHWTVVIDETRALLQSLIAMNAVLKQRIGLTSLQTYHICQQLVRDERHARLRAHLAEMKRLNKFGRVRRKAAPPPGPVIETQTKKQ